MKAWQLIQLKFVTRANLCLPR